MTSIKRDMPSRPDRRAPFRVCNALTSEILGSAVVGLLLTAACDETPSAEPPGERVRTVLEDGRVCYDQTVYRDEDGDGFGVEDESKRVCIAPDEEVPDYASGKGDCEPTDPAVHPGADEICGDFVDENCEAVDELCPTSLSADITVPDWDCSDAVAVPDSVFAWARFDEPNEYYEPGGCFVFFEGLPNEFYVRPVNLNPTAEKLLASPKGDCLTTEGCICPSMQNWSYDRGRLYAFTLAGDAAECEKIVVYSHEEDQPVSNNCRKFLYQIHFATNEFSFVATSRQALEARLERFDTIEIACFEGQPFDDLPFASLLTAPVVRNPDFEPLPRN